MRKLFYPVISIVFFASIAFSQNENRIEDSKVDTNDRQEKPQVEKPRFPLHWGKPPLAQTKDYRPLPGGFGMGSSTLANWIKENLEEDKANGKEPLVDRPKPKPRFPVEWGRPPEIQLTDVVKLPGNFGMGSSTLAYWIKENIEEHGMPEKPVLDPSDPKRIESETLQALKEGKITIDEAKEKLKSVRKEMADKGDRKMPKRLPKPEIPEDLKEKIAQVKVLEKSLHSEIKAQVEQLGKEATKEQIKETVEAFKKSNKDRFEEIKNAHAEIRENIEENKPAKPVRPELSDELKAQVEQLHAKRKEMQEAQKVLHQNLKEASKEERKEMIAEFKEANQEKHQEIKVQAKAIKEEIREFIETDATRTSDL